jgi:hypothetical protein
MKKPRAIALADRYGPWGGSMLGTRSSVRNPFLMALRWLGVDMRRLVFAHRCGERALRVIYYSS